ncbi:MAG: beta-mannanase, partial [Ruminiclostridium sp.]
PDYVGRDNAKWLWFALWKGDYIINSDGTISYAQVSAEELDYAYNNELYITKDELPDFARY